MDKEYSRLCSELSTDATKLSISLNSCVEKCKGSAQILTSIKSLQKTLQSIAIAAAELADKLHGGQNVPVNVQPVHEFIPQVARSCAACIREIGERIGQCQSGLRVAMSGGMKRVWMGRRIETVKERLESQATKLQLYLAVVERTTPETGRNTLMKVAMSVSTTALNEIDVSPGPQSPSLVQELEDSSSSTLSKAKRLTLMRRLSVKVKADSASEASSSRTNLHENIPTILEPTADPSDEPRPSTKATNNTSTSSTNRSRVTFSTLPTDASLKSPRSFSRNSMKLPDSTPKSTSQFNHELFMAIIARDVAQVSSLICLGADVNHANANGHTALHIACGVPYPTRPQPEEHNSNNHELLDGEEVPVAGYILDTGSSHEISDILLDFGAAINRYDNFGRSPLFYACLGLHFPLVRALVKRGAKIRQQEFNIVQNTTGSTFYSPDEIETNRELIDRLLKKCVASEVNKRQSVRLKQENGEGVTPGPNSVHGFRWSNISGGWVQSGDEDGVRSKIYISPAAKGLLSGDDKKRTSVGRW